MQKIFISSTSDDLKSYRQSAIDICNRLGLQPIAMEFFPATDKTPVQLCRDLVAQSDVYLGLIAHRYGHIPDGETRSMTHIEFDEATRRGIPRLCFVVDPAYAWNPMYIEHENRDKLDAFKAEIDTLLTRNTFTTEADLATQIIHALVEHLRLARPPEDGSRTLFKTNITTTPIIGREQDIQTIKKRLNSAPRLVIRGWPGVGKTTLVGALAYDEELQGIFTHGILKLEVGETPDVLHLLRQLARELGMTDAPTALDELGASFSAFFRQHDYLIIVDDVWETDSALAILDVLAPAATIVTTRFKDVAEGLVMNPAQQVYPLDVLSPEGAKALLTFISPDFVQSMPTEAETLIDTIERLPLAIIVAGRLIHQRMPFGEAEVKKVLDTIEDGRLLQEKAPPDRYQRELGEIPSVQYLIAQSVKYLDDEAQLAFASLGGMAPKPALFSLEDMRGIWLTSNVVPVVEKLLDRGLLEFVPERNRFQMHALIAMYARKILYGDV